MRLPRDISGDDLAKSLKVFGYEVTRQTGSHLRLTTTKEGEHHLSIPRHDTLKLGTLSGIISDVSQHFGLGKDELISRLFSK